MDIHALKKFHGSIVAANETLHRLAQHSLIWKKEAPPTPEEIIAWVEAQQALLQAAEEKTSHLKNTLLETFSKTDNMEEALAQVEDLIQNPEAAALKNAWDTYQQYLAECLSNNQENSARISKALPFIHHLLHLFLGHEQEIVMYNAKGKKTLSEINRAS